MNRELHQNALKFIAKDHKAFVAGEWTTPEGRGEFTVTNPATAKPLGSFIQHSKNDVDRAVGAAFECHKNGSWRKMNRRERARLMRQMGDVVRRHTEELAMLECLPNGKTYIEALNDDLPDCGDIFDYYAGWIDKYYGESCPVEDGFLNYTIKEPLGVCGLIVPWNFPLLMGLWKICPAIAAGNSVVVKPSEYTPYTMIRFFELIHEELDLPKGLFNLVLGDGQTGQFITEHNDVHKIGFTGSTNVGKKILQKSGETNLKSVSLELGGKSPNIFFDDLPDLDFAIERSFNLIFSQKGEKCSEPTRFLIHRSLHDQITERLISMAKKYRVGDPLKEDSQQGAQCMKGQFEKILSYIDIGKNEGANLVHGGKRAVVEGLEDGFFVEPTIFTNVKPAMRIFQEEIFGPVLSITSFDSEEEAIALANDSEFGLAAGLWTKDISRAHRVAEKIDAGSVFINRYGCYDFSSPFGGYKQSGIGKDMGIHSMSCYTKTKSVWVKY